MNVSVRDFLNSSYNHEYITIVNNIPSIEPGDVYKTLWEGEFETIDNYIPDDISKLNVIKWGIEKSRIGIVIYVNYEKVE